MYIYAYDYTCALACGPFYLCGGLSGVVGIDGVEGRAQAVLVREDGGVLHNTHRVTKKTASEVTAAGMCGGCYLTPDLASSNLP